HRRSLARFDFDSVLLPYNIFFAQNDRYRQAFEEVLTIWRERNVAGQVLKSIARGPWATTERTHTTWYQPLEAQADIDRAVHWAMGLPGVFLNTAGTLNRLPRFLDAAGRFQRRPSDDEMAAMLGQARMTSLFGFPTSARPDFRSPSTRSRAAVTRRAIWPAAARAVRRSSSSTAGRSCLTAGGISSRASPRSAFALSRPISPAMAARPPIAITTATRSSTSSPTCSSSWITSGTSAPSGSGTTWGATAD